MRLYTSKVIADWLGLTERRVRQLRDEGIIEEQAPGLYDLRATTRRYISYLRSGSLADERAGLTRAKREAAEMENALRRGELHRTEEIESGIKTMRIFAGVSSPCPRSCPRLWRPWAETRPASSTS